LEIDSALRISLSFPNQFSLKEAKEVKLMNESVHHNIPYNIKTMEIIPYPSNY
jgi:hypothetical protein